MFLISSYGFCTKQDSSRAELFWAQHVNFQVLIGSHINLYGTLEVWGQVLYIFGPWPSVLGPFLCFSLTSNGTHGGSPCYVVFGCAKHTKGQSIVLCWHIQQRVWLQVYILKMTYHTYHILSYIIFLFVDWQIDNCPFLKFGTYSLDSGFLQPTWDVHPIVISPTIATKNFSVVCDII